jgi:hypothetical protein
MHSIHGARAIMRLSVRSMQSTTRSSVLSVRSSVCSSAVRMSTLSTATATVGSTVSVRRAHTAARRANTTAVASPNNSNASYRMSASNCCVATVVPSAMASSASSYAPRVRVSIDVSGAGFSGNSSSGHAAAGEPIVASLSDPAADDEGR